MSTPEREARNRWQIEKYRVKTDAASTGQMYNRFNPTLSTQDAFKLGLGYLGNFNFSMLSFGFNLSLLLNVVININIKFPVFTKAQYGTAKYGEDLYDPLQVLGILMPTKLIQEVSLFMIQHFTNASQRGYKLTMPMALKVFDANRGIFDAFGPDAIWMPMFRRIEAWRNWSAFYGYSMYGISIYPSKSIYIRITDNPTAYGWPDNTNIITSDNVEFQAIVSRYPDYKDLFPFPEYYLKTPNKFIYQSVYGVSNYGHDNYMGGLVAHSGELASVIAAFKATQNPLYRELVQFTGHQRMVQKYAVHSAYQTINRTKLYKLIGNLVDSPSQLAFYYSFMLEYTYKRRLEGLIAGELIIQKWIKYGLSESLLRLIAGAIPR